MRLPGSVVRSIILLVSLALGLTGCFGTRRTTVLSTDTLKVVEVTESVLDINISKYRHYTTYVLYLEGKKVDDRAFIHLLGDPDAGDGFVHNEVVVLDERSILLSSHNRDSSRCWTTRLIAEPGRPTLETITQGRHGCMSEPAPAGWRVFHDLSSNLLLVRERPFKVYPLQGYWFVMGIQDDTVVLFQSQREEERLTVRLVRIGSGEVLAEQHLPMSRYADPHFVHTSAEERERWLLSNFTVSSAPAVTLQLRPDNQLKTISAETWAEYQRMDRESREADARAVAAGEAKREAQRQELREAEKARLDAVGQPSDAEAH